MRFATRLNSFAANPEAFWPGKAGKPTMLDMAQRAATVEGLTDLDLNFPDHLVETPATVARRIGDLGLTINGFAMRYYTNPAFKLGAFTNPDPAVRREAIDLTKKGIDATREAGSNLMTLWLGQDGFDYGFQADYDAVWSMEVDGIREVAEHDPDCMISIEYKPNEPRAYSLLGTCASTLLAIQEAGCPRTSASPSTSPTSSMPTSSLPSRRRSRIATAGCSASTSTTATPSATTG